LSKEGNQTVIGSLLTEISSIQSSEALVVIGTYDTEQELHPSVKKAGKFQK